jgi:hypothetical protein
VKYLTTWEDLNGKTVKEVHKLYWNQLCLELDDGDRLVVDIDGDSHEFYVLRNPGKYLELQFGFITKSEYEDYEKQQEADRKKYVEERERLEYARLKAKFEE